MFLKETKALQEIQELLDKVGVLHDVNLQAEVSRKIRDIIEGKEIPSVLGHAMASCYEDLCSERGKEIAVAVRSAGVKSHPGMYETYLNIRGKQRVLEMVKKVWASTFNVRTVAARVQQDLPVIESPCIGVGVLEMVSARCAGVCFTVHPVTGDPLKAMIEANWGLGESVVSGMVSADTIL
jgi:pyruvate,water dikinase